MSKTKSYLQMEPIIGDSKNSRYKKAVEIYTWSFIQTNHGLGTMGGSQPQELYLVLPQGSKAGKQFYQYLPQGKPNKTPKDPDFDSGQQVFKEAVLTTEKLSPNSKLKKFTIMKMSPVIVVSVGGGRESDSGFLGEIILRFKKIEQIIP